MKKSRPAAGPGDPGLPLNAGAGTSGPRGIAGAELVRRRRISGCLVVQCSCRLQCTTVTDNGSENQQIKNSIAENISSIDLQHLVAQKDIHFSNSMIEAVNKQLKYRFLYHHPIANRQELEVYLRQAVQDFNNRPHHVLNGLSPNEVLQGKLLLEINHAVQSAQATSQRIIENKKTACCYYSF